MSGRLLRTISSRDSASKDERAPKMCGDNIPLLLAQFIKAWRSDHSGGQQETHQRTGDSHLRKIQGESTRQTIDRAAETMQDACQSISTMRMNNIYIYISEMIMVRNSESEHDRDGGIHLDSSKFRRKGISKPESLYVLKPLLLLELQHEQRFMGRGWAPPLAQAPHSPCDSTS